MNTNQNINENLIPSENQKTSSSSESMSEINKKFNIYDKITNLIIEQLKNIQVDKIILVGKEFLKHNTSFIHFEKTSEFKEWLPTQLFKDCFFLAAFWVKHF